MTTPAARRDVQAHQESVMVSDADIVGGLREVLGASLVAYLGEVKETRAVAQWVTGDRRPSTAVMTRLRTAYQAAALLGGMDRAVVRAWFQGMNPLLKDMAPAASRARQLAQYPRTSSSVRAPEPGQRTNERCRPVA